GPAYGQRKIRYPDCSFRAEGLGAASVGRRGPLEGGSESLANDCGLADPLWRRLAHAARGHRARHGARARSLRFVSPACAADRVRRDRAAYGARLPGTWLHVADFEQAHGSIWWLTGKSPAVSAVDRARGAGGGAENGRARRAHYRQRLARGRAD